MRHAICYVSNVDPELNIEEIKDLLSFCQERNRRRDIKGVLLYSDGNFFQVLEGKKTDILDLWKKIESDPRHNGIMQVIGRDIEEGSYDSYRAEVLGEEKKFKLGLPAEYAETIQGMNPTIKKVIERMLGNFIMTRS